ncbi:MAG: rhodanese-like domain-containing protein [Lachnospiraceae bacterium]|nr:rhodanese-like domain-containing protein [Lachnospiraceae bacterium]
MRESAPTISVKDVYLRCISGNADCSKTILIDLREENDYKEGHIANAIHIDEEVFTEGKYYLVDGYEYILYCDHGGTSMRVAMQLKKEGFNVLSVVGGMEEYKRFLVDIRQSKL